VLISILFIFFFFKKVSKISACGWSFQNFHLHFVFNLYFSYMCLCVRCSAGNGIILLILGFFFFSDKVLFYDDDGDKYLKHV
jgi:hypothetical protein